MIKDSEDFNKELDFLELFKVLFKGRFIVLSTVIFFLFSSVVFLSLTPSTYTSKVTVSEPSVTDLKDIKTNIYNINGILEYSEKNVFDLFVGNIQNYESWLEFIAQNKNKLERFKGLLGEASYQNLKFKHNKEGKVDVLLSWKSVEGAEELLVGFVQFVNLKTSKEITSNILTSIDHVLSEDLYRKTLEPIDKNKKCPESAVKADARIKILEELKPKIKNVVVESNVNRHNPLSYKVAPNRALIIALAILFGLMLGILLVFLFDFIRSNKSKC